MISEQTQAQNTSGCQNTSQQPLLRARFLLYVDRSCRGTLLTHPHLVLPGLFAWCPVTPGCSGHRLGCESVTLSAVLGFCGAPALPRCPSFLCCWVPEGHSGPRGPGGLRPRAVCLELLAPWTQGKPVATGRIFRTLV